MRLYIAGPMTGIPHFNIPLFDEAAAILRVEGHDVVSPAELDDPEDRAAAMASPDGSSVHYENGKTWGDFLARDVKLLSDGGFEGIAVLPGWHTSKGARLETYVGAALHGLPVFELGLHGVGRGKLFPVAPLDLYRAWSGNPYIHIEYPAFTERM